MSKFRTTLSIPESRNKISHKDKIVLMGSCFAQEMGEKMNRYRFDVCINPFGILFNPGSIAIALNRIINKTYFTPEDLSFDGKLYHSFDHHGRFSNPFKEEAVKQINKSIDEAHHHLQNGKFLLITFGSAWIYRQLSTGRIVANCHKFSQNQFSKELLAYPDILQLWNQCMDEIRSMNPKLEVIFSVSPVRYLRDGFTGNQLSKSHLLLAVNDLCSKEGNSYFPAYEIQMDDLRDYRFYKDDLIHPSSQAVQYIWENFSRTWIDSNSIGLMDSMEKHLQMAEHRSIGETESEAQIRIKKAHLEIESLLGSAKGPS
jgi:GSCFA family